VTVYLEMISGALGARDELVAPGRQVQVADAGKVKHASGAAAISISLVPSTGAC
jgi:hypothetical protein